LVSVNKFIKTAL